MDIQVDLFLVHKGGSFHSQRKFLKRSENLPKLFEQTFHKLEACKCSLTFSMFNVADYCSSAGWGGGDKLSPDKFCLQSQIFSVFMALASAEYFSPC